MNELESNRILLYCLRVRQALGLTHWRVILCDEPAEDHTDAQLEHTRNRYIATLAVAKDFDRFDESRKRFTLFHEMLHLTHSHQYTMLSEQFEMLDTLIGLERVDILKRLYFHTAELQVDALTNALEPLTGIQWPTRAQALKVQTKE